MAARTSLPRKSASDSSLLLVVEAMIFGGDDISVILCDVLRVGCGFGGDW